MKIALACGAALLCASASPPSGMGTRVYAGMPPERFQGDGVAVVVFTSDVEAMCGPAPMGKVILACAKEIDGVPVLILPNPCALGAAGERFATLACHEKAHSLNWTGMHEE